MEKNLLFERLKKGLIVSCQALPEEPLHDPYIMARMAYAAKLGGAAGIRANSVQDIAEIKKVVDLPIIGIVKRNYPGSDVFITPTLAEIEALAACGVDMIAMDATDRMRPFGEGLDETFAAARSRFPGAAFMADCSTAEEARHAARLGFDCVATTLSGARLPNKPDDYFDPKLLRRFAYECNVPVIAEGGIWSPEQMMSAFEAGAHSVVIGTAITRPMDITRRYVKAIERLG